MTEDADVSQCWRIDYGMPRFAASLSMMFGHVQIAGVPARGEPDRGEVNYGYLFSLMDELGYAGWVGCEYRPAGRTQDGLGWLDAWRQGRHIA